MCTIPGEICIIIQWRRVNKAKEMMMLERKEESGGKLIIIRNNFHFCFFLFVRSHHGLCIGITIVLKYYTFRTMFLAFHMIQQFKFRSNGNLAIAQSHKNRNRQAEPFFCHMFLTYLFRMNDARDRTKLWANERERDEHHCSSVD